MSSHVGIRLSLLRRSCLASLLAACAMELPAQGTPPAGTRELDDVTFVLPAEWSSEEVKGAAADLRAHYVLKVAGRPYAELYVSSEPATPGQSLEQLLQAGIEKTRDKLPDYQPMGTRRMKAGELDAVVHDFAYSVGTPFRGRVHVLIANGTKYSFFFNTASGYFQGVEGSYTKVMGSLKRRDRPAVPAGAAGDAAPLTIEEHGLLLDLPVGWRPSGDAAGAKYRWHDADGQMLGSLFPLCSEEPILAVLGPVDGQIDGFVKRKQQDYARQFESIQPAPVQRVKLGGFDVRMLEFTCRSGGIRGYFRWYFVPMKDKEDEPTVQYGWTIRHFGFFTMQDDQLETRKAQFDAIMKTVRRKGAAAPATATPPAQGELPVLEPEGEATNRFRDPAGRFELPLPNGGKQEVGEATHNVTTYADKATRVELWCMPTELEAAAKVVVLGSGKKLNGTETTWQVDGKDAKVRLYSHQNAAGQSMATVVASYPAVSLVVAIELPAKGYADAQAWIGQLLRGLTYRK